MEEISLDTQIIIGRKVFFIHPNQTIFPESFCEDFLAMGFECYFLMKDSLFSLESKLDVLVNSFDDIVLFFYIDAPDPTKNISWIQFIKALSKKYQDTVSIGILFTKRTIKDDNERLQYLYQNEAKASCGAYMLEYDKKKNFNTILKALIGINARGRRKNVRVICSSNCKIRLRYNQIEHFITIADLSLSHFSCAIDKDDFPLKTNDKFENIEFNIRGTHFSHTASVLHSRPIDDKKELCIFTFVNKNGQPGLDSNVREILVPKIYSMLNENFRKLFLKIYEANNS